MASRHYGALDFYRFIAATGVAVLHFSIFAKYDASSGLGAAVTNFTFFVDFFFILSGFVIGLTYSESVSSSDGIFTYLRRRIARIYPLHILTLGLFLVPGLLGLGHHPDKANFFLVLQEVMLVRSWPLHASLPYNFPSWSISVEWAMYLVFPTIILLYRRCGFLALMALIATDLAIVGIVLTADYPWTLLDNPLRALPTFTIGVLISRIPMKARVAGSEWLSFGAFVFSVVLMIFQANTLFILTALVLTVFFAALSDNSLFNRKIYAELGNASYAIYMLHAFMLTVFVDNVWPRLFGGPVPLSYGAAIIAITIAVSIFVFRYFEVPMRRWIFGGRFKLPSPAPQDYYRSKLD